MRFSMRNCCCGGRVGEMLQSLPKLLLPFRRQAAECRIVLQFALLFRRG